MTPFALHLREIDNAISIRPDVYESYLKDFIIIRNYILTALTAVDCAFAYLFGGPTLTGSIPLKVRIHVPNEFDVLLNIALPHSNLLNVQYMQECPGFLQINLKHMMQQLYSTASAPYFVYTHLQKLIDPTNFLLCREKLQQWIHYAFQLALQAAGNRVIGSGYSYILTYKQHGISHTIYAKCQNTDNLIKIDFVPAVTFVDWSMPNRILFATPRGAFRSAPYIRDHSFFLCNATAEIEHFINAPANVHAVARLLKCSYNRKQMPRFKTYFITTALLWEMHQPIAFWQQPLDILYLYMIEKLIWYMKTYYLPFFWEKRFNFLCYLTKDDCKNYQQQLRDGAKKLLNSQCTPKPLIINNDSLNNLTTKMLKLRLNKSAKIRI